jgi:2-polyprenyl-6-methoxyphenol hydroxylase-like FAD-dependent oxidoreductase
MSPTAVVGAVAALKDSTMLAKLLLEVGVNVVSLRRYEAAMREYAGDAIV